MNKKNLRPVTEELVDKIINQDATTTSYGCGSGSGSGSGSGCGCGWGCGCGCGCGDEGIPSYGSGNNHPYKGIFYDKSISDNPKLNKQFDELLACPTVNGVLNDFVRGSGNLTIQVGEIEDDNCSMKTDLKDGKVYITVNSKHVTSQGYTYATDGVGSTGYTYNGTRQGTFAALFTHEAYHAQYDITYSLAAKTCKSSKNEDVYNQLVKQGQNDLANAFFEKDEEGNWIMRRDIASSQHELIAKQHTYLDKAVEEFATSKNW